uniref:glycosyltransferase family 2 protein n=1 Tax=Streptomyces polyasparticus TaxID=2767826 RepID=UPI001F180469|nr:glycosyltransferase family 2 protein [Streptomyces polyasparticus]
MSSFLRPAVPGKDPLIAPSENGHSTRAGRIPDQYRPVSTHLAIAPPVSVVIPAMNEAENLPYVFETLPDWIHEVVLVDGNSTDDTVAVAKKLWPDVKVVTQQGKGKGDALITGFAACTGDIIVMVDADGSADGHEILSYVSALVSGADFAKGSRFANGGGTDDMTPIRKLGNWALCAVVNRKFGARYTDLCYGYNAFWRYCLDKIDLDCTGFEVETLMNIRVVKAGLRVQEIPSHEYVRIHGASNLRAVRDGFRVLKVILKERADRQQRRRRAQFVGLNEVRGHGGDRSEKGERP